MRILVFDDNPKNCRSAETLLKDHDLTIVSSYEEAEKALRPTWKGDALHMPNFDVVMTDLLVPVPPMGVLGPKGQRFVGQEMPLGMMIAVRAIAVGIKKVAVVTDANHHDHPASAALDRLKGFEFGDTRLLCSQGEGRVDLDPDTGEVVTWEFLNSGQTKYPRVEAWNGVCHYEGLLDGCKDWKKVLDRLLNPNFTDR